MAFLSSLQPCFCLLQPLCVFYVTILPCCRCRPTSKECTGTSTPVIFTGYNTLSESIPLILLQLPFANFDQIVHIVSPMALLNNVCLPFYSFVSASVKKNWLPLSSGVELCRQTDDRGRLLLRRYQWGRRPEQ